MLNVATVLRRLALLALLALLAACGGGGDPAPAVGAPPTIARVEISPKAAMLTAAGQSAPLVATAFDANGNVVAATFSWRSNTPSSASVDAAGVVTALVNTGTSQIIAEAGGVGSLPAMVLMAQPKAIAQLVKDAQILGKPELLDSGNPNRPGFQFRVLLGGLPSLSAGQLLLGSEGIPFGGRVVAAEAEGTNQRVTLEVVNPALLFDNLVIDERIPLAQADVTVRDTVLAIYDVQRRADGSMVFTPKPGATQSRSRPTGTRKRALSGGGGVEIFGFECKPTLTTSLVPFPLALASGPLITTSIDMVLEAKYSSATGLERLVITGTPKFQVELKPVIKAALKGKIECDIELFEIHIPIGGPLGFFIGGWVPVSAGMELSGELGVDGAGLGLAAKALAQATMSLGVACTPVCTMVKDATNDSTASFTLDWPAALLTPSFEAGLEVFGKVDLKAGNPWLPAFGLGTFELTAFEAKIGLKQDLRLASAHSQATDPGMAAGFGLEAKRSLEAGSKIADLMSLLSFSFATIGISDAVPLAAAPTGSFTISPSTVLPGDAITPGQKATFTVLLDKSTYLGIEAVEGIEFLWLKPGGSLVPAPADCAALPASTGQVAFSCETSFTYANVGTQTFYAFMKARLFGVPLPTLFEIAKDAKAMVSVAPGGGKVRALIHSAGAGVNLDDSVETAPVAYGVNSNPVITLASIGISEAGTSPILSPFPVRAVTGLATHKVVLESFPFGSVDNVLGYSAKIQVDLESKINVPGGDDRAFVQAVAGGSVGFFFSVLDAPVAYTVSATVETEEVAGARAYASIVAQGNPLDPFRVRLSKCQSINASTVMSSHHPVLECLPLANDGISAPSGVLSPGIYGVEIQARVDLAPLFSEAIKSAGLTTGAHRGKVEANFNLVFSVP